MNDRIEIGREIIDAEISGIYLFIFFFLLFKQFRHLI